MLKIQVIGIGCPNCIKLKQLCDEVVSKHKIEAEITHITDIELFGELGIFITPGLIVNGNILSQGKIPTKSTLNHWIENYTKVNNGFTN